MSFKFSRSDYPNSDIFLFREWIETTGKGGWASSSLSGANIRRYHGLYISDILSERKVLLSKLDETIHYKDESYPLGCNVFKDAVYPKGLNFLTHFSKDLFPVWYYEMPNFKIQKSILGLKNENSVLIRYEILEAPGSFSLSFNPLVAARDYHSLSKANNYIRFESELEPHLWNYQAYSEDTRFYVHSENEITFSENPLWYYRFFYTAEIERGQDFEEDLFSPGTLATRVEPGGIYYFLLAQEKKQISSYSILWNEEINRREKILNKHGVDKISKTLILASDQFIIHNAENLNSIIAGYHWFLDWGRDTMISLPGLCLPTGRFDEAKRILQTFAKFLYQGIIPNRFADSDGKPEYNTADATLWFFVACYRYYLATKDKDLLDGYWMGIFKNIIDWHVRGTLYNIHVDHDGLLIQGEAGIQLTWMDAKVGDWVVTPRTGKAVEINALWYNTQQIYSFFLEKQGDLNMSEFYRKGAANLQSVFIDKFWLEDDEYLIDVLDGNSKDLKFRPNQLFAISLPFPLVHLDQARSILKKVKDQLLTPRGIRTLSPNDPDYRPYYAGDQYHRDQAYHQGTAWSWLIGPYIDSLIRVKGEVEGRIEAKQVISDFLPHLEEAGVGSVSEIFDASPPYYPKGCIAQAWGVAEILRVYLEYRLYE